MLADFLAISIQRSAFSIRISIIDNRLSKLIADGYLLSTDDRSCAPDTLKKSSYDNLT